MSFSICVYKSIYNLPVQLTVHQLVIKVFQIDSCIHYFFSLLHANLFIHPYIHSSINFSIYLSIRLDIHPAINFSIYLFNGLIGASILSQINLIYLHI
ncbi:MAG: hypothetical protein ACRC4N_09930 [Gammaproteobacteria bacterium]